MSTYNILYKKVQNANGYSISNLNFFLLTHKSFYKFVKYSEPTTATSSNQFLEECG